MLPLLEFAYNQTPNSSTGIAPFEAQQGYLPSIPTSLLAATYHSSAKSVGVENFLEDVRETYKTIHAIITANEKKTWDQTRQREDSTRTTREFFVGDEVLMYWEPFSAYTTQPRKQRFKYQGPFTVVEVKPPHCVRLEGLPEKMPTMINVEYVHLYHRAKSPELRRLQGT